MSYSVELTSFDRTDVESSSCNMHVFLSSANLKPLSHLHTYESSVASQICEQRFSNLVQISDLKWRRNYVKKNFNFGQLKAFFFSISSLTLILG